MSETLQNPYNAAILERLPFLELPDSWLVAGCLFQTLWNRQSGQPPTQGIRDYDLFYFEPQDLSASAEASVQARVSAALADLPIAVEAKNQARVHLWYEDWFGYPYAPLASSREGMQRFLVAGTCVGLQVSDTHAQALRLFAPFGLHDLYEGVLRPNPLCLRPSLFDAKARSYQQRWPWLRVGAPAAAAACATPLDVRVMTRHATRQQNLG